MARTKRSVQLSLAQTVRVILEDAFKDAFETGFIVTEYQFHPTRKWRFDFAIPSKKIGIEVHGAVWDYGKQCPVCKKREHRAGYHTAGKGFQIDREKMNQAQIHGWIILEFADATIRDLTFLEDVKAALEARA